MVAPHLSHLKSPPLIKSTPSGAPMFTLTGEKNYTQIKKHLTEGLQDMIPVACVGKSSTKQT